MDKITRPDALRERLASERRKGHSIGFVPTMGALHAAHLELVNQARRGNDVVVVSVYVNHLQFAPNEDFDRYPRDIEGDTRKLEAAGVDILFAPSAAEMHPLPMKTVVDLPSLGGYMEGAFRTGYFAGIATIVCKLFNIVGPDRAYFGEKDYQQLLIVRRLVSDLMLPVDIVGIPIIRDVDGVALSSRNRYLSPRERVAAGILRRTLDEAERLIMLGDTEPGEIEAHLHRFVAQEDAATPLVAELRCAETLDRAVARNEGPIAVLLVVQIGTARLLDNRIVRSRDGWDGAPMPSVRARL